jgi:hypothetical protein
MFITSWRKGAILHPLLRHGSWKNLPFSGEKEEMGLPGQDNQEKTYSTSPRE